MDANLRDLLDERDKSLNYIEESLNNWDGSMDQALEVSETNGPYFERLESLDESLKKFSHPSIYSEEYVGKLSEIMEKHMELLESLRQNRQQVLDKMKEINKKDEIIGSYINREIESIFIDKDL